MKALPAVAVSFLLILSTTSALAAGKDFVKHPGFFDVGQFDGFAAEGESVDVSLEQPLLSIFVGLVSSKEPGLAASLNSIQRIAVRSFAISDDSTKALEARVEDVDKKLARKDWQRIARVQEEKERVYVYARSKGDAIDGLDVMVLEYGHEATFVNIIGNINPVDLGRLVKHHHVFDDDRLEGMLDGLPGTGTP